MITKYELTRRIDHALLKANITYEEIMNGCRYAKDNNCVSVCVNTNRVKTASQLVQGSNTVVGTVIGFPLGAHTTYIKVKETVEAYKNGAVEMDMVIDIGALKSGDYNFIKDEIMQVVKSVPSIIKVIIETAYLTSEEIITISKIIEDAGAHYVKTSTGFAHEGATIKNIELIKKSISKNIKIKASGGISTLEFALKLLEAGCTRIGTSKTEYILSQIK